MLDAVKLSKKVVGTKQTTKMIKAGKAEKIFLAKDVDPPIFNEIEDLCKQHQVPIEYVERMSDLGKACGINRKAATAAILKD